MKYSLFLLTGIVMLATTTLYPMDHSKKVDWQWEFNKISTMDKQDPAAWKITGYSAESQNDALKTRLKAALIEMLQCVELEYAHPSSTDPIVTINTDKLQVLAATLEQFKKADAQHRAQVEKHAKEEAIAQAALAEEIAWEEYFNLRDNLACFTGTTKFWENEGIQLNEKCKLLVKIATIKQEEIRRLDVRGLRFDKEFRVKWHLNPTAPTIAILIFGYLTN